ncbi:hypothetical protein GCM10019017_21220 [Streptomyces showdoensis]
MEGEQPVQHRAAGPGQPDEDDGRPLLHGGYGGHGARVQPQAGAQRAEEGAPYLGPTGRL